MTEPKKRVWEEIFDDMQKQVKQQNVEFGGRGEVVHSSELQRVLGLRRRILNLDTVFDCTDHFRKEAGTMQLLPIQNACLADACVANGLFGPIAVGAGKTLVTLLLPEAMNSECTVLLVPPSLKKQLKREIDEVYGKHFNLPMDRLKILTYHELSSPKFSEILDFVNPDLIIADECHKLRRKDAVRTGRFLEYMKDHPKCRFVGLSGTVTGRSIKDYAHLIELALGKNSPLPGTWGELLDWASCIDADVPDHSRRHPGALRKFCGPGETIREGFRRRLVQTEGVVATAENQLGVSLILQQRSPDVPAIVSQQLQRTKDTWTIGDEEFEDHLALARATRQLSQGFYYRWAWPNGVVDVEWVEARRAWHKEIREFLKHKSRKGVDSPLLYTNAVINGVVSSETYSAWARVKNRKVPPTIPVWLDEFVIDDAIEWANAVKLTEPGIIWYEHKCVGEWLAQKSGLPHYGAGTDASVATAPVIICSIRSQGTGKNLQFFSRNLVLCMPANGAATEQLLGRTHRMGQKSDEVVVEWLGHMDVLREALEQSERDAAYVAESTGQRQKLLYCTRID